MQFLVDKGLILIADRLWIAISYSGLGLVLSRRGSALWMAFRWVSTRIGKESNHHFSSLDAFRHLRQFYLTILVNPLNGYQSHGFRSCLSSICPLCYRGGISKSSRWMACFVAVTILWA